MNAASFSVTQTQGVGKSLAKIVGGALFIALLAQIRIPLWFTPVPISLHTFAIMILGGFYGKKETVGSVVFYLTLLLAGLPLLSGAYANPAFLLGPTGGYLLGMAFQGFLDAHFASRFRQNRSTAQLFFGLFAGSAVTLSFGAVGLIHLVGWNNVFLLGVLPFLPGDFIKIAWATSVIRRIQ